jgi:hypothetical protein
MYRKFRASCLAIAMLSLPTMVAAAPATAIAKDDQRRDPGAWRLSTGLNYSSGDYGDTPDTNVFSIPVGIKFATRRFSFRVSVPYVWIDGPGSLIQTPEGRDAGFNPAPTGNSGSGNSSSGGSGSSSSGSGSSGSGSSGSGSSGSGSSGSGSSGSSGSGSSGGSGSGSSGSGGSGSSGSGSSGSGSAGAAGVGSVAPGGITNRRSGFGDVTVAATYSIDFGNDFYADVTGRLKLPTASTTKRLGTGKVDATVGVDLIKDIGKVSIYAGGRHRFSGKPDNSNLRDVWGAGAGVSARVSKSASIGVDYDWQQSAFATTGSSSELTGWASLRLTRMLRVQIYAGTGFTTNSANFIGGIATSWRFR